MKPWQPSRKLAKHERVEMKVDLSMKALWKLFTEKGLSKNTHLCPRREVRAAALHAVLNHKEASQLCNEVLVAVKEAGRRRKVAVQLQAAVALIGLPEFAQPTQALMHLRAPAGNVLS